MSGWTDGPSGEGAGADDGKGFDDGGAAVRAVVERDRRH